MLKFNLRVLQLTSVSIAIVFPGCTVHTTNLNICGPSIFDVSHSVQFNAFLIDGMQSGRLTQFWYMDFHYANSNFSSSFYSIFIKRAKYHNDIIMLHIFSTQCKAQTYLLYDTECLDLSIRQLHTQPRSYLVLCNISYFHVSVANVNLKLSSCCAF